MKSLLEKVHIVEQQAAQLVMQEEQAGRQAVAQLLDHEREIMSDTRDRAEKEAVQIIEQKVAQAKTNQASETVSTSVQDIQEKAAAHRAATIQYAEKLLLDTYKP
jgi:hypothetical protein